MNGKAYALLLVAVLFGVIGQLLIKHGMSQRPGYRLGDFMVVTRDVPVVSGFCCYVISTLLYLKALGSLDLSLAYPTVSLGYVLVIVMSKVLFKERIIPTRWVAIIIICVGVALVGLGSK
ncbi:MAG: EamA family transporter [Gammaproteobacteria bacterium]|nr:EamA family transporter [Gammaproteobacteria bacterium]